MKHNAHIYIRRDGARAVLAALHENQDGVWCEDDTPSLLDGSLDPARLGEEAASAAAGARHVQRRLRDAKLTDWSAYRVSGAKSVRQFEEEFITLRLTSANDANLVYEITGYPSKGHELQVAASISRYAKPSEIGSLLIRVYQACLHRTL